METLLHVEPLTRHLDAPLAVGSNDYIFYGSQCTADDENVGQTAVNTCLGSPLENTVLNDNTYKVPLVKTVGKIPNYCQKGEVITETIHYLNGQTLIPIRMKLRSGFGEGLSISHLPSLNLTRSRLTSARAPKIIDPRSEIVDTLIDNSIVDQWNVKPWVKDWVQDDMIPRLRGLSYTPNSLSMEPVEQMIDNYLSELSDVPNEIRLQDAQSLWLSLVPETAHLPPAYHLPDPITIPLSMVRQQIIPNNYDFRSWGHLDTSHLPQIAFNPPGLEIYAEWFDTLPLTDLNIDLVCGMEGDVTFYHCHLAVNRFDTLLTFNPFKDAYSMMLEEEFTDGFLKDLLEKFVRFHPSLDTQTTTWINMEEVKIKFIKTMREEAVILLYPVSDNGKGLPVAGIKFDLGLQFLAPMSVMEETI